jgi:type 2A phosphatase activator TIP41
MKDCFFGLLRCYLRVDNVMVRIMDTRIFHSFGDNYIFREFNVKEDTYESLQSKGFKFTSEWSLSHSQSDLINRYLSCIFTAKDIIVLD